MVFIVVVRRRLRNQARGKLQVSPALESSQNTPGARTPHYSAYTTSEQASRCSQSHFYLVSSAKDSQPTYSSATPAKAGGGYYESSQQSASRNDRRHRATRPPQTNSRSKPYTDLGEHRRQSDVYLHNQPKPMTYETKLQNGRKAYVGTQPSTSSYSRNSLFTTASHREFNDQQPSGSRLHLSDANNPSLNDQVV